MLPSRIICTDAPIKIADSRPSYLASAPVIMIALHSLSQLVSIMRTLIVATIALLILNASTVLAQGSNDGYHFSSVTDPSRWTLINVDAESVNVDGKTAIHLQSHGDSANRVIGLAALVEQKLLTGVVEVDLKGKSLRGNSFLGIAFNVPDANKFEAIYFRLFNFNVDPPFRERGVQYISWPGNSWEHLRKTYPNTFENRVSNVPDADGWFHARIELTEKQVRVFVNAAPEPSLVVTRLAVGDARRSLGLFVDTSDGYYANLRVTPDK